MSDKSSKLLVVLDLDETLFHSSGSVQDEENRDFFMEGYDVYKRPFVDDFLNFVFENFSVGFFTSATQDYAYTALSYLLTDSQFEKTAFVFSRERCTVRFDNYQGFFHTSISQFTVSKNLKKVFKKGFSRHRVIAVDDKPENFTAHYGNCLPIKPFLPLDNDEDDKELLKVIKYLDFLDKQDSVRRFDHRQFLNFKTQSTNNY